VTLFIEAKAAVPADCGYNDVINRKNTPRDLLHFSASGYKTTPDIPQPVWAAAFGIAQTPCDAGFAVFRFRNFSIHSNEIM